MNPDNNNPQTVDPNLQKLEQDLKDLEVKTQTQTSQPEISITQTVPATVPTPIVAESTDPVPPITEVSDNSVPPKKSSPLIAASIVLVVIALLATLAYVLGMQYFGQTSIVPTATPATACTMEAKLCPDGSYVGRTGPNCEFSACPTGTPTISPTTTATPSGTPTMTPTGTPISTPTSSPSASPASI